MKKRTAFILCAIDFTPLSREAGIVARQIALKRRLPLELVHVATGSNRKSRREIRHQLDIHVARFREAGVDARGVMLSANAPAIPLREYIRQRSPELVVMGNRADGVLDRWASGSLSEQISGGASVPVLLIQNSAFFSAWDWTGAALKVQLCLHFDASSETVLRWARTFRQMGPCEFYVGHVIPRRVENNERSEQRTRKSLQEVLKRDLRKKVRDILGEEDTSVFLSESRESIGRQLHEIARERNTHLLAVGAHQWRGIQKLLHGSVSSELQHLTDRNVIVIPLRTKFDPRAAHIPDFHRVLVTTDLSESGDSAIPFACGACGIGGLVRIVHVVRAANGIKARKIAELRKQLNGLVPAETGARCQPPEIEIIRGEDTPTAICAEAARFGADLVCMASHGAGASRAVHGSVTKVVLKLLRRPLLVIGRPSTLT